MKNKLSRGEEVTWSTSGEHEDQVKRAKSLYGDGTFVIVELVFADLGDPDHTDVYVVLADKNGRTIMRDGGNALFETYLFQRV